MEQSIAQKSNKKGIGPEQLAEEKLVSVGSDEKQKISEKGQDNRCDNFDGEVVGMERFPHAVSRVHCWLHTYISAYSQQIPVAVL